MKTLTTLAVALVLGLSLVAPAVAADQATYSGNIVCAKCTLKKADANTCQDVLVVKDDKGATTEYYVTKKALCKRKRCCC